MLTVFARLRITGQDALEAQGDFPRTRKIFEDCPINSTRQRQQGTQNLLRQNGEAVLRLVLGPPGLDQESWLERPRSRAYLHGTGSPGFEYSGV